MFCNKRFGESDPLLFRQVHQVVDGRDATTRRCAKAWFRSNKFDTTALVPYDCYTLLVLIVFPLDSLCMVDFLLECPSEIRTKLMMIFVCVVRTTALLEFLVSENIQYRGWKVRSGRRIIIHLSTVQHAQFCAYSIMRLSLQTGRCNANDGISSDRGTSFLHWSHPRSHLDITEPNISL